MPLLHMISMALQVCSPFEEVIVEFLVQMLGLKIRHNPNAGNRSWLCVPSQSFDGLGIQG